MEACFIHLGRATDTRVIKSSTLGARFRDKSSASQIYTNGPLLFTGYNTAPQFTTALRMDADAQMHQGVGEQVHTTHTAAFVCVVFLNFHSLLRFQLHTCIHSQGKFYPACAAQNSGCK